MPYSRHRASPPQLSHPLENSDFRAHFHIPLALASARGACGNVEVCIAAFVNARKERERCGQAAAQRKWSAFRTAARAAHERAVRGVLHGVRLASGARPARGGCTSDVPQPLRKLHSRDKLEDRDFEAHTCAICDKVFLAAKSRDQHFRSLHWPDDPVDTSGDWALASEIDADAKSFGYYVCPCKNSWLSAHAFSRSGQQCRKCASVKWLRPYLMWRNDRGAKRGEAQDKMSKPHLRHLCERCCKGLSCTKVDP